MKKTFKSILLATLSLFAFTCCEDVPAPYQIPGTEEKVPDKEILPSGDGTLENPYNVAGVVAYVNTLQADTESPQAVYVKGIVLSNTTTEATITQYGNMTFTMIDEGNKTTTFTAFQVYGPGNKKFTSVSQIKTGDEVIVYGKVVNYKGNTPETVGKGASYVYSIQGNSEGGGGETVEGTPVTCAEAVELTNALADGGTSTETYTVTGYITEVVGDVSKGQQTFWMADAKDGGRVFEAYWANLPEGVEKFVKGSKVKITGQLMKYVNKSTGAVTPEIKNATVEILEAGEEGGGGQATEEGTPVTCAQAVELANALNDGATSTETYTVTGYITEVIGSVSKNQQTFWMADAKDGGRVFEAYWANLPEGVEKFVKGSKVKITGQLMKYVKNGEVTPEIKNANVVILEAASDEGGEQGGEQGDTSEYGISLSYTTGTNCYDDGVATINGVEGCKVLKIGTSKAPGDFTLTVPAGKHSFYAVTWKGSATADVVLKNGDTVIKTVTVQPNDGATQNSPYTFTVTESDKYEFEVSAACTLTVTSDKRVIFFGIK